MRITFLLLNLLGLASADIGLVVDVSGTMARYGNWQADVVRTAESVLRGDSVPELGNFESTPNPGLLAAFNGNQNENLVLVPFGTIQSDRFPYFGPIQTARPNEVSRLFPMDRALYTAIRTNKSLAVAVAAKLAGFAHGEARLVVISDFLIDAELTDSQRDFVNDFESRTRQETPVILSWRADKRVQMKFIRIHATDPAAGSPPRASSATIQLVSSRLVDNPKRLQFQWRSVGGPFESYRLVVRDASHREVFARSSLIGNTASFPNPPTGKLTWIVSGYGADGSPVVSPTGTVVVESGIGLVLAILLIIGLGIGGLWWKVSQSRRPVRDAREYDRKDD
jgi:hypothetical protein